MLQVTLIHLAVALVFAGSIFGADSCALTVRVIGRGNQPLSGVLVELINPEGKVVANDRTVDGITRFCDFGFGTHSIKVGSDRCLPATVHGIRLHPHLKNQIVVFKNSCGAVMSTMAGCEVYVRARSNVGPLPHATLAFPGLETPFVADEFGRIGAFLPKGKASAFTLSLPGYVSQTFTLTCHDDEAIEREIVLSLEP